MHRTEIFFVSDSGVIARVSQDEYAALASGRLAAPRLAFHRMRVADWYVRRRGDAAVEIANETYTILFFDDVGNALLFPPPSYIAETKSLHAAARADPYASTFDRSATGSAGLTDRTWRPTPDERRRMLDLLR